MKKIKSFAVLFVCALLLCSVSNVVSAEDYSPDFDVIFVIDGSDSMDYADPDGVSLEATKLFLDLCSYPSTRVGYVLYRNTIKASAGCIGSSCWCSIFSHYDHS